MTNIREQIENWDGHVCPACGLPSNTRDTMEKMLAVVEAAEMIQSLRPFAAKTKLGEALAALESEDFWGFDGKKTHDTSRAQPALP